ncbi:AAA family ATPase, partial [Microbacterium sp. P5_E9]
MREEIFSHLRDALVSHGPTVIVLHGTAGAGKSRVARECIAWHRRRGRRVTWVTANASLQTILWGAFVELEEQGESVDVLRALCKRIGRAPGEVMLPLLVCDDAHHLDERSAAVVAEVAREGRASIVLTVRDGARVPDAIRAVIEGEKTLVIGVPELDRAGVAEMLAAVVRKRVRPSSVDQIYALTRGNFLYLRELLRGEIDASSAHRGDEWTWQRSAGLPQGLANVVGRLLSSLTPALTDLVDLLAVASPLRCSVYERIVGPLAIERAESLGLVRSSQSRSGVDLEAAHPLIVEIARERMGVHRRKRLSGLLATEWAAADLAEYRTTSTQDMLRMR